MGIANMLYSWTALDAVPNQETLDMYAHRKPPAQRVSSSSWLFHKPLLCVVLHTS